MYPYDHLDAESIYLNKLLVDDKLQIKEPTPKAVKPKEYLEISINGGTIHEVLNISKYESPDEEDQIQDFLKRKENCRESQQQIDIYKLLVNKYKPRNYFNIDPPEKEEINQQKKNKKQLFSFQTLVIQEKRKRIFDLLEKLIQRKDSDQQNLFKHSNKKLLNFKSNMNNNFRSQSQPIFKNAIKLKIMNKKKQVEQKESFNFQKLLEIEQNCQDQILERYKKKNVAYKKQKFKEDLIGRKYNPQLSYLALRSSSQKRIEPFVII